MHSFEVHSNESACIESDRLGLEQVQDKVKVSSRSYRRILTVWDQENQEENKRKHGFNK